MRQKCYLRTIASVTGEINIISLTEPFTFSFNQKNLKVFFIMDTSWNLMKLYTSNSFERKAKCNGRKYIIHGQFLM